METFGWPIDDIEKVVGRAPAAIVSVPKGVTTESALCCGRHGMTPRAGACAGVVVHKQLICASTQKTNIMSGIKAR
jgi:hypothetical protein